jgi:hypothetical protein
MYFKNQEPIFNSGFSAIELLSQLFFNASLSYVEGDMELYYRVLTAINIELEPWIKKESDKKKALLETELNALFKECSRLDESALRKLHCVLLQFANDAGLRLKTRDNLPGVLNG